GLYDRIVGEGALIAEPPVGTVPQARHFPPRNRLISGASLGVVVVEATMGSGSLITTRFALEQGREVLAVPGSPLDPRCRGTNDLIRRGATLVEGAADVLEALEGQLGRVVQRPHLKNENPYINDGIEAENDLEGARGRILEALGANPVPVDEVV